MKLYALRFGYFLALFVVAPFLFACSKEIGLGRIPQGAECQLETHRRDLLGAKVCQTGICENRLCVDHCNGPETGDPANGCQVERAVMAQGQQPVQDPAQQQQQQQAPVTPGAVPTAGPAQPQGI